MTKNKNICYIKTALMRKSNFITYTSESGIVGTDYKCIAKEHLGANYRKEKILVD